MTARVTHQVVQVGYETDPKIRVSTLAVEVIRSISSSALAASNTPVLIIATG
jgi:hypothetical protein